MKEKFLDRYKFNKPIFRVRNIPNIDISYSTNIKTNVTLKLVWHGGVINYGNSRGVQIIVKAISICKTPITLYLQGDKIQKDFNNLLYDIKKLGIENKIVILGS